jgi:CRP-like cAMP-binding protein
LFVTAKGYPEKQRSEITRRSDTVTRKDIAEAAGVAPSTVSAVLNGQDRHLRISNGRWDIRAIKAVLG